MVSYIRHNAMNTLQKIQALSDYQEFSEVIEDERFTGVSSSAILDFIESADAFANRHGVSLADVAACDNCGTLMKKSAVTDWCAVCDEFMSVEAATVYHPKEAA